MTPRLENWAVIAVPDSPYQAPELWRQRLHGNVYGHPRFGNGTEVTTSPITSKKGENILTRNTEYELGIIDTEYEKLYPNARERLLNSLKEGN